MTIKTLAKLIAKHEGKKVQVNIAQINEILGVLSDLVFDEISKEEYSYSDILTALFTNGTKRAKKKKTPFKEPFGEKLKPLKKNNKKK